MCVSVSVSVSVPMTGGIYYRAVRTGNWTIIIVSERHEILQSF